MADDPRFVFGTWKIEVVGGYASAVFLMGVAAYMGIESIARLVRSRQLRCSVPAWPSEICRESDQLRFGTRLHSRPNSATRWVTRFRTRSPPSSRCFPGALARSCTSRRWPGLASPTSPDIDHYTTYFGDRSVLNTVKSKLGLICSMANRSTLCLYYRGKSCSDPRSDWPYGGATEQEGIKPTAFVGAANRPKNREGPTALFQIKSHRNGLQSEGDIHALEAVGNEAQDRMYGPTLMVHGAPMAFARLDKSDRTPEALSAQAMVRKLAVRTYGDELCRAMALPQPEKAANNADSHAYFCMKYAALG